MFRIDNEKFGLFVSELRKEQGLTQRELAERLFVSDKAVSKWERGLSLPDISLLQPMADILGVTITELLGGQYMRQEDPPAGEVEEIMEEAVAALTAQEEKLQRQNRRRWRRNYAAAFLCGAVELWLLGGRMLVDEMVTFLLLPVILGAVFGLHFCFFAREKLPVFYDQYRINFYSEGMFRMNVPGVRFNNSNWPHILHALRVWCIVMMAGWTPAYAVLHGAAVALLPEAARPFVMMILFFPVFFGGLFGPVYMVGKKYQ